MAGVGDETPLTGQGFLSTSEGGFQAGEQIVYGRRQAPYLILGLLHRQTLAEGTLRDLPRRANDRVHRRERCPGQEVSPCNREDKHRKGAGGQRSAEGLEGRRRRLVGFTHLYHTGPDEVRRWHGHCLCGRGVSPIVYFGGGGIQQDSVDVAILRSGRRIHPPAHGLALLQRPTPLAGVRSFRRKLIYGLHQYSTLPVADDYEDPLQSQSLDIILAKVLTFRNGTGDLVGGALGSGFDA